MDDPRLDRSIGELISNLSQQTADLVKQEMRLAKAELSDKLSNLARHAMMLAVAVVVGLAAVMAVTAAITLLMIDRGIEPWIAAIITAAVMGIAAVVLAMSGISAMRRQNLAPVETINSLKETTQWIKQETR
jgi:uncharacterized membrane protein YqjE